MNMPLPTPPITYNGNSVLLHGQALFARHIATAMALSQWPDVQSAGFVAELISVEQTRCGATFDALASLCPAVSAELKDAYDAAVIELRTIRHKVLDTLKDLPAKAFDEQAARKAFAGPVSCQQAAEYFERRKDLDHDVS